ncbi:MAG: enoyl-[acyl-carrier-protein] reductase FabI, partial [Gammaproteobacteria bacterium]
MGFLTGKKALIVGLASNRSIAWGIAQAMQREGAELAFTYQNEKLKGRVEKMAEECGSQLTMPCEVTDDEQIAAVFEQLKGEWDELDILVHSVAFAPREELDGPFVDAVTRGGFAQAHDISSYSFAALAKASQSMLSDQSALLAMTYLGAVRTLPNYNV